MLVNSLLGNSVHANSSQNQFNSLTSPLFWNLNKILNFYGCTAEYMNSSAKAIYIWLGVWRCNGPGRHRMLTVINAYYSYYEILQVCRILH